MNFFFGSDLAKKLPLEVKPHSFDSPHTKTYLLLQAHFSRLPLPSSDYFTDTKSVLDQAIRILQVSSSVHCLQCLYNEEAVSFFLAFFIVLLLSDAVDVAALWILCSSPTPHSLLPAPCSPLPITLSHSPLPAPRLYTVFNLQVNGRFFTLGQGLLRATASQHSVLKLHENDTFFTLG